MKNNPRRACLLLNRTVCTRPEVERAVEAVEALDVGLTVRISWRRSDVDAFIKDVSADGITRFVVGGGDGALNLVANTVMRLGLADAVSLGILPLGTANDFALGTGLTRDDPAAALHRAATGTATPIDLGEVNGRYFVNVASGGFGAEVTATTPRELKAALGGAAYSLMGLVKALRLEPYTGQLTLPDGSVDDGTMIVMAVGNSRYAGGGFDVAPKADPTDGLLDLAAIRPTGIVDLPGVVRELADPFNAANKYVQCRQLDAFTLEADRPLHMNLDGEPMVDRRFAFKTHPQALHVVLGDAASD